MHLITKISILLILEVSKNANQTVRFYDSKFGRTMKGDVPFETFGYFTD